jgi:DNA-binding response OmpR family regulator
MMRKRSWSSTTKRACAPRSPASSADEGYLVDAVESGEAGLQALERAQYDLLLLDVWLPKMDGLETLPRVRALDADCPWW